MFDIEIQGSLELAPMLDVLIVEDDLILLDFLGQEVANQINAPEKKIRKATSLKSARYLLSKKSLNILSGDKNYFNEIYEDLYVAKLLEGKGIYPKIYPNLSAFVSPLPPNTF